MKRVETALRDKIGAQGKAVIGSFGVNQVNPQQEGERERNRPPRSQYVAQVTILAETPKLEPLGPSVEVAMKAGAARLNQVSFSLKNDNAARKGVGGCKIQR